MRKTIKPILELLAGVPTIVFGYFALTFFTPEVLARASVSTPASSTASRRGIIIGFLIIPTIASISEDSMSAVPASLREGSFGLGASKLQTTLRVVFPAALSGIVASIVLGVVARGRRDHGGGHRRPGLQPTENANPLERDADHDVVHRHDGEGRHRRPAAIAYKTIFAVGITLFVLTLIMNLISIRFVPEVPAGVRVTAQSHAPSAGDRPGLHGREPLHGSWLPAGHVDGLHRARDARPRAILLVDVAIDGAAELITWSFITRFSSIAASRVRHPVGGVWVRSG